MLSISFLSFLFLLFSLLSQVNVIQKDNECICKLCIKLNDAYVVIISNISDAKAAYFSSNYFFLCYNYQETFKIRKHHYSSEIVDQIYRQTVRTAMIIQGWTSPEVDRLLQALCSISNFNSLHRIKYFFHIIAKKTLIR